MSNNCVSFSLRTSTAHNSSQFIAWEMWSKSCKTTNPNQLTRRHAFADKVYESRDKAACSGELCFKMPSKVGDKSINLLFSHLSARGRATSIVRADGDEIPGIDRNRLVVVLNAGEALKFQVVERDEHRILSCIVLKQNTEWQERLIPVTFMHFLPQKDYPGYLTCLNTSKIQALFHRTEIDLRHSVWIPQCVLMMCIVLILFLFGCNWWWFESYSGKTFSNGNKFEANLQPNARSNKLVCLIESGFKISLRSLRAADVSNGSIVSR